MSPLCHLFECSIQLEHIKCMIKMLCGVVYYNSYLTSVFNRTEKSNTKTYENIHRD